MKKNLFLTCALALFAVVGVSAQDWSRTLATGLPGKEITHDVNGTQVTQYRAETALFEKAGATGVRYTVVQTTKADGVYGGGPFFALGEIEVYDADGNKIAYKVTSNADHNSGGADSDGAGLPALNDGNYNNYFHSSWGGTEPGGLHYLELTFEKSVDAFQLVWYTRPNQHVNRPQVVGLTEPGKEFTEEMLFAEYEFKLGNKVSSLDELEKGGAFVFYADGTTDEALLEKFKDGATYNGSTYISLSGYATGKNEVASPTTLAQLIPGAGGKFVIYQPVLGTYYANPDRWTDGYNGKNGWLRAYSEGWTLGQFEFTQRADGDFEITTELTRQYTDGAWNDYAEPIKVWVGYDMRGNLKVFPQSVKEGLEIGDYSQGFGLPVDFGFTIYNASVNKEVVPDKTVESMCEEVLASTIKLAKEKKEAYADYAQFDIQQAGAKLDAAIAAAEAATDDLAAAFKAKDDLTAAIAPYVSIKVYYYMSQYTALNKQYQANIAEEPYDADDEGKYTSEVSGKILSDIYAIITATMNGKELSYSAIEANYATIENLIAQFETSTLHFTIFPEITNDIPADKSVKYPNNAIWSETLFLTKATKGIRLTFLENHRGSASDGGNFPAIALGEFRLYDQDGKEVKLDSTNFVANHTETAEKELFDCTVARLCDGAWGKGDLVGTETTAAKSYYHSPWASEPQEYIYLDVTFPEAMKQLTFEVYSRDITTTQNQVSLFPKKVAISEVGVEYDPLIDVENPYNVAGFEKVTQVDELTADGLYVIRGMLNTQKVLDYNPKDSTELIDTGGAGKGLFYHGISSFHADKRAVRADGVYRFLPNEDGTFKALNLGLAQYWPSTEATGFVRENEGTTYEAAKAANLNIIPSENVAGTFVMYELHEGLTTDGDSIDTDEDEKFDAVKEVFQTPYVVFMDWYDGLATRPVKDPQPFRDAEKKIRDGEGDALCFNKANGEGEWEIYKVTMDNPDFFWLSNMTGVLDDLGIVIGDNPGCVSAKDLGGFVPALENGKDVVRDSAFVDATAAATTLANEIAVISTIEKNPMAPGVYQVVSANKDFAAKQDGAVKALYAHVDANSTVSFGWKDLEEDNLQFYFDFKQSTKGADLVAGDQIAEEHKDLVYTIKAIATYDGPIEYYIGNAEGQSTPIDLFVDTTVDYLVLAAHGSAFTLTSAGKDMGLSIHANGHGGGSGTDGNIVYWDGAAGASQWYLRKVDYTPTSIDEFVSEGTEVVSVSYYTPAGAAVPAPVKGINVVVTVYANGVVEAKKVLVK